MGNKDPGISADVAPLAVIARSSDDSKHSRDPDGVPAFLGNDPLFREKLPVARPRVPLLDLETAEQVARMLRSGVLTKGSYLEELEQRLAAHLGTAHAVAVSSGTLGLLLTYHALGLSGEVIVPSFTFMATVHPLVWVGAEPRFVDIDPETWCVDPTEVEAAISDRTTAIVAVHTFGNPARVDDLERIAKRRGIALVYDSAHAFGSRLNGQPIGGFGHAEVFSLSPTKLLIAGEGGVVATNDAGLAEHVRSGREYGTQGGQESHFPGVNARLPEFNAMLALKSLDLLEESAVHRNRMAAAFKSELSRLSGISFQKVDTANRCSYKDLGIVVQPREFGLSRDQLAAALRAENIETRRYFDPPVHTHQAYQNLGLGYSGFLPVTDEISSKILTLPLWSDMPLETVALVCRAIWRIHRHAPRIASRLTHVGGRAQENEQ